MVMPYQWQQMTKAMNMPELANDIRFRDPRSRRDNNKELQDIIERWLAHFENREQAIGAQRANLERYAKPEADIRQLYLDKTIVRDPLLERGNTVKFAGAGG
jgi:crotonobetainyl-CoA:carnitine CoA-transferase CaiB-like acyl-CoA transferase